jgi:hypothetical protein
MNGADRAAGRRPRTPSAQVASELFDTPAHLAASS